MRRGLGPASFDFSWLPGLLLWLGVPALLGWTLWVQIANWANYSDDSFFTFRVINNWISGNGLVYNTGERLEVFSNPLWLFILGIVQSATGGSLTLWSKTLGLIFTGLSFVSLHYLCCGLAPRFAGAVFGWSAAFMLMLPGLQIYAGLGLETPLLMCLLLTGVAFTVRSELKRGGLLLAAAIFFGLAGITRPEGPLYGLLWLAFLAWKLGPRPTLLKPAMLMLAPVLAYAIFRKIYYGAWLPYTFWVKPPNIFSEPLSNIAFFTFQTLLPALLLGATLLLLKIVQRRRPPARDETFTLLLTAAGGPIAAGLIFHAYAQADWMLLGRFLLPVLPLMIVVLMAAVARRMEQRRNALLVLLFALFAFVTHTALDGFFSQINMNSAIMQGASLRKLGSWVIRNLPRGSLIVGDTTGTIGYMGLPYEVRDFSGLTDPAQLAFTLAEKERGTIYHLAAAPIPGSPLMARRPAAVQHLSFYEGSRPLLAYPDLLTTNYSCILREPLGWSNSAHSHAFFVELWVRDDLVPPSAARCGPV